MFVFFSYYKEVFRCGLLKIYPGGYSWFPSFTGSFINYGKFLSSTIATSPILSVSSLEIWFDMYYKFLYLFSMPYIFSLSFTLCAVFWKFPNIYSTSEIYLFSFENHLLNFIKRILFWRRSFGPCQPYFVFFIVYGLLHRFSFSF